MCLHHEPNIGNNHAVNDLEAIEGYLQLEMPEDAFIELRNIPEDQQSSERYKELLLATEMMLKHWESAAETAKQLCEINPSENSYFIHAAFCLHETAETRAALEHLSSGPTSLQSDPLFHYNLACYHAVLGNEVDAYDFLSVAFSLDPDLEETAKDDDDLKSIYPLE